MKTTMTSYFSSTDFLVFNFPSKYYGAQTATPEHKAVYKTVI